MKTGEETVDIVEIDQAAVTETAMVHIRKAQAIVQVKTADERELAVRERDELIANRKAQWKEAEPWYKNIREKADKATEVKKAIVDSSEAQEKRLKQLVMAYDRDQAAILKAQEEAAAAEARKAAEDERLRQAELLEKENRPEAAEAVVSAPVAPVAPAPVAPPASVAPPKKMKGASSRWNAKIDGEEGLKELFSAWGSGKAPMPEVDEDILKKVVTIFKLNGIATSMKKNTRQYLPGVDGVETMC